MDKLTSLWKGASYQDHLLQSYRGFHLTVASILLVVGAIFVVTVFDLTGRDGVCLMYGMLVVITIFAVLFSGLMKRMIAARAADVDYYHSSILEQEKDLPASEQILTKFKVYQQFGRKGIADVEVTNEIRSRLTEKDRGHTRKVLDKYVPMGFYLVWCFMHVACLCRIFC